MKQVSFENIKVMAFHEREAMGLAAAQHTKDLIKALLMQKPFINIIFAAAPSQNEFLKALVDDNEIEFQRINAFHMDEYIGLSSNAPQGFGNFLKTRIFSKRKFKSVNYINGNAKDIDVECERYTMLLAQFPPDIICAGIGENAHIAFNDPPVANFKDPLAIKRVKLDEVCRQQQVNDGCFVAIDDVPTYALTLTIPTLLKAQHKVVIVPATSKANAVRDMLYAQIDESVPASILRTSTNCTLFLDKDSAALIPAFADYLTCVH